MENNQEMGSYLRTLATGHIGVVSSVSAADAIAVIDGTISVSPPCPECGVVASVPVRQGMGLPYKCDGCGKSFSLLFAMSDLSQLKAVHGEMADVVADNCNVKIVGRMTPP